MRAGEYIRVSDDEQAKEGYSIDAQKALLARKCAEWGYEIVDTYVDDGYSAKNMKRPGLQRMLKDVELGKLDVIVFWRLDRFTRRSKDFQKMTEHLEKYDCSFRSATEPYDTTTAIGRFQLELAISLGQLERETTAERVHFVMEERHLKGLRNGAVAPYGYDLVDGELIVNPMEAEIVKRIFSLYQQNKSTTYIAKLFNRERIPKRDRSKWAAYSVYYIITNPVYTGKLRWNYRKLAGKRTGKEIIVDGSHEPIISVEEFEHVQKLRQTRATEGKRATSDYAFTGVLRCAKCGYAMVGTSKKTKLGRKRYYKCLGRFNYGLCNMPLIAETTVTNTFLDSLELPQDELDKLIVVKDYIEQDHSQFYEQLKSELEQIQKRKRKWQEAFANDVISLEDLRARTEEDRAREEYIKGQLEAAPIQEKSHWTKDEIIQQLRELRKVWFFIDEVARKHFINDVFRFIEINTDVTDAKGGPGSYAPIYITRYDFNI